MAHKRSTLPTLEELLKAAAERDEEAKQLGLPAGNTTHVAQVQDAWNKACEAESRLQQETKNGGLLLCLHESCDGHEEDDRVAHYLIPLKEVFSRFKPVELVGLEVHEVAHLLPESTMRTLWAWDRADYAVDFNRVSPRDVVCFVEWYE